jgi:hypothetical protein
MALQHHMVGMSRAITYPGEAIGSVQRARLSSWFAAPRHPGARPRVSCVASPAHVVRERVDRSMQITPRASHRPHRDRVIALASSHSRHRTRVIAPSADRVTARAARRGRFDDPGITQTFWVPGRSRRMMERMA